MRHAGTRATLAVLAAVALVGCCPRTGMQVPPPTATAATATAPTQPPPAPASFAPGTRPKLVVAIVIDMMRVDYLSRWDAYFGETGFQRLLRDGAFWTGHYGHYATYTGPGHAQVLSGSYAYVNGISTNRWWNYEKSQSEAMVYDPNNKILGQETKPKHDVSPANFRGSTVGDELILATGGRAKTIGVTNKGRGGIMMAGRLAKTYFMNPGTGEMTTSTYYAKSLPAWVHAWNQRKLADSYFGKTWDRLLPPEAYASSVPDNATAELGPYGLGTTFPHVINGGLKAPGPDYYQAFMRSPFANEFELEFAKVAIDAEQLGQRGVTDLLAISISGTDLMAHYLGPFSHENQDMIVRLDRQLGAFFDWLYAKFGHDQVLIALTADHGATPVPEQMAEKGFHAARIKKKTIHDAIEKALDEQYGAADWVTNLEDPHVFLNRELIKQKRLDIAEVRRATGEAVLKLEGFGGYFTRDQMLAGDVPDTMIGRAMLKSYYAPRGGDVVLWVLPFYFWGKYGEKDGGTTHGTIYPYDSEVPVFVSGPGVRAGRYGTRDMVDLAATLSALLGIPKPGGCEGQVVPIAAQ